MEAGGRAFVAVDVHYLGSGGARAAAVVAANARFCEVVAERTEVVAEVLPYRPGEFYLRELPPIRAVLHGLRGLSLLVVDGYADLDSGGPARPGRARARRVRHPGDRRGQDRLPLGYPCRSGAPRNSVRPLFVTAAGMPRDEAADLVRHMAGQHRLPDAVRRADELARTGLLAARLAHRQDG